MDEMPETLERRSGMESHQTDSLTGLANLSHFMEEAAALMQEQADSGRVAFVFFDVDNFKSFNQKYGFQNGNEFLKGIAELIGEAFPGRLAARLTDDHFAVMDYKEGLDGRVNTVLDGVKNLRRSINAELKAGVYVPDSAIYNIALVMDRARMACESIKRAYDQNLRYYDWSLEQSLRLKNHVISDFHTALENKYIKVFYQPEVRTLTRQICGYEALARWQDPVYGMLSPAVFIEVLESVHLIHLLDLYVIREVCRLLGGMLKDGKNPLAVSVNLSRIDFQSADMFEEIEKIRDEYGVPSRLLNIEVTESALDAEAELLRSQIDRFRENGYEVWMDDFGSGYSTLNNLKDYHFDVLKIDMNFLRDFGKKPQTRVILAMVVDLAKELGMHTLAEGVETKEQYQFLRTIGCEKLQGYLFSKPLPLNEVKKLNIPLEDVRQSAYYNALGRLNVLSDSPLRERDSDYRFVSRISIAIVEQRGEHLECLYANRAFGTFLSSVGLELPQTFPTPMSRCIPTEDLGRLRDFLAHCAHSDKEEHMECIINSNRCAFSARRVASRNDGVIAHAIVAVRLP